MPPSNKIDTEFYLVYVQRSTKTVIELENYGLSKTVMRREKMQENVEAGRPDDNAAASAASWERDKRPYPFAVHCKKFPEIDCCSLKCDRAMENKKDDVAR